MPFGARLNGQSQHESLVAKNQEPRTKNQEPRTKNQELRTSLIQVRIERRVVVHLHLTVSLMDAFTRQNRLLQFV